jgi:hypothetical protein
MGITFIASSAETALEEYASFMAALAAGEERRRQQQWQRWATTQHHEAMGLEDDHTEYVGDEEDEW